MPGPPLPAPAVLDALSPIQREAFLEAVEDLRAIGLAQNVLYRNLTLSAEFVAWAREYRRILDEGRAGDAEAQWMASYHLGLPEDGMARKLRRERAKDREAGLADTVSVTSPREAA